MRPRNNSTHCLGVLCRQMNFESLWIFKRYFSVDDPHGQSWIHHFKRWILSQVLTFIEYPRVSNGGSKHNRFRSNNNVNYIKTIDWPNSVWKLHESEKSEKITRKARFCAITKWLRLWWWWFTKSKSYCISFVYKLYLLLDDVLFIS